MPLEAGTRLGPYEILGAIGAGGMGEVYKARDTRLGRMVAIKVLAPHLVNRSDALERFEREARVVAALSHPNIVVIYDVGDELGLRYVVSELLEGETLRERLVRDPPDWQSTVSIMADIARGLAATHSKNIIHRDIKPENVFLTAHGIKILDFGLARLDEILAEVASATDATVVRTPSGLVLGTIGYMSPEQVAGRPAEAASDIFSFGCVLYELLAGRRPFDRPTAAEAMHAILKERPPRLELPQGAPWELESVVAVCLEKDPAHRSHSASDLVGIMQAVLKGEQIETAPHARLFRPASDSIAVIPIEPSADDQRAFADLLTDEIGNHLATGCSVSVMARSRVAAVAVEKSDPMKIGEGLGVALVLAVRMTRLGDAWSVQADLTDVAKGTLVWGQRVTHRGDDPIVAAGRIAEEIALHIAAKTGNVAGPEPATIRATPVPISSQSLHAVSAVRSLLGRGSPSAIRKAIDVVTSSTRSDEGDALAAAVIAESLLDLALRGLSSSEEVREEAVEAAHRSLGQAPDSMEPLLAAAGVGAFLESEWGRALDLAQRAAILDGEHPRARLRLSQILAAHGRTDEAVVEAKRASELDIADSGLLAEVSWVLIMAGRHDDAMKLAHEAVIADPESVRPRMLFALASTEKGSFEEAHEELQRDLRTFDGDVGLLAAQGYLYAKWGRRAGATKIVERLLHPVRPVYTSSVLIARVQAALGDADGALATLELAADERSPLCGWIGVDPAFKALRTRAPFTALLRSMGLPA